MVNTVRETRKQVRKAERCATLLAIYAASRGVAVRAKCVTNFENSKSFLEIFGDTTKNEANQKVSERFVVSLPCESFSFYWDEQG